MPLAVDPTVGGAAANSYAAVETAAEIAEYTAGAAAARWLGASPDEKVRSLVTATREIDSLRFRGVKVSREQALEFPRKLPGTQSGVLPKRVVYADVYLAFERLPAPEPVEGAPVVEALPEGVKRARSGEEEIEFFTPATVATVGLEAFPPIVQQMLAPFVYVADAPAWGSGLAQRVS